MKPLTKSSELCKLITSREDVLIRGGLFEGRL